MDRIATLMLPRELRLKGEKISGKSIVVWKLPSNHYKSVDVSLSLYSMSKERGQIQERCM